MPSKPKAGPLSGKTGGIQHKWWLLGGIGVGGLAYLYYRHNAAAAATTTTDPTATDPYAADTSSYDSGYSYDGYGTGSGGSYSGGGGSADPSMDYADIAQAESTMAAASVDSATALGSIGGALHDIADAQPGPPETNKHWQHQTVQWLLAHGYTKGQAHSAINAFLAGAPMTAKQVHTVESAVGHVGPPPQPVQAIHQEPAEKPHKKADRTKPKAKPPRHAHV